MLFAKLRLGRCDLVVEQVEILAGFSQLGKDYLTDPLLAYGVIPDHEDLSFHMMFADTQRGIELKQLIDEGINRLKNNGELDNLLHLHGLGEW